MPSGALPRLRISRSRRSRVAASAAPAVSGELWQDPAQIPFKIDFHPAPTAHEPLQGPPEADPPRPPGSLVSAMAARSR
jgi:hypothetical protein